MAGLEHGVRPLGQDFSEEREKRVERAEESDRGWMMLFLVSRPKLTEKKPKEKELKTQAVNI